MGYSLIENVKVEFIGSRIRINKIGYTPQGS